MLPEAVYSISVEFIESSLNKLLADFLGDSVCLDSSSGFSVTRYVFSGIDRGRYPMELSVELKSWENFKEFSLPPKMIISCLETVFSALDGAEGMKFKPARVSYQYPKDDGCGDILIYCVIENEKVGVDAPSALAPASDGVIPAW